MTDPLPPSAPATVWVFPFRPCPNKPARLLAFESVEAAYETWREERGACQNNELGNIAEYVRTDVAPSDLEEQKRARDVYYAAFQEQCERARALDKHRTKLLDALREIVVLQGVGRWEAVEIARKALGL